MEDHVNWPKTMGQRVLINDGCYKLAQHGSLDVIPECGHYVPIEQPEALNAILRGVIAAHA